MEIEFGNIEVGEAFVDPMTGMNYKKIDEDNAKCLDCDNLSDDIDYFFSDDLVII